jgi:hypothetical protein
MHFTSRHHWLIAALLFLNAAAAWAQDPCPNPQPVPSALRLPEKLPRGEPVAFEKQIPSYLQTYQYRNLGWCVDKAVRDTGPYVNRIYYGTHPAVRIYYSPEVMTWLRNGRQGPIADGAVILKEQYDPPAARYTDKTESDLEPTMWTFMIKNADASWDGWFWGDISSDMPFGSLRYPNAGFGISCVRCHASAEREHTFAALDNIKGYPGEYLTFRVDDTWRVPANGVPGPAGPPTLEQRQQRELEVTGYMHEQNELESVSPVPAHSLQVPDNAFTRFFKFVVPGPTDGEGFPYFPSESLDHIVEGPKGPGEPKLFVTSDQCQSCHSGFASGNYGPNMFIAQGSGVNVSPYGEWRWSPMGLAGRDPIFFAQFESEMADLDKVQDPKVRDTLKQQVTDNCFLCHGAMGKRQFDLDHHGDQNFKEEFVFDTKDDANFKYGALARDGISCAICHHMMEDKTPGIEYFLEHSIDGNFEVGKPDEITGPFKDDVIATYPMDASIGVKPKFNAYITSARLCGSCHTINLPVVDKPPIAPISPETAHSVEQNTYLEWVNSQYQNEFQPVLPSAKTCQDCHMPGGYANASNNISVPQIQTRIASIEDDSYPATEHRAPLDKIRVRYRETGFGRHELVGINAFLLEMFNQFSWVMGVRTTDYMSGATNDLPNAIDNMVQQARNSSAQVAVSSSVSGQTLAAWVKVANLAGHRFPSGVGFRRAFIELEVKDASGRVVWGSGRTNELGVIVGGDGKTPLSTEFFERDANGNQQSQEHYDEQHPITSEQQVQIYEELLKDAEGNFTTSFLRRDHEVKDNRLLPIGWTEHGPDPSIPRHFLGATHPKGRAWDDPNYRNGKGISIVKYQIPLPPGLDPRTATVTATLYYQSIPPYYLADRFRIGANRPDTRRLYYLTANLNWQDTPFVNWKLLIASASAPVAGSGNALSETSRPVVAQEIRSAPREQPPSGSTQPQAAPPAPPGGPPTSGVVREKETKETKESTEIKDHPSDWAAVVSAFFGMVSAFAWPGALILFLSILLTAIVRHPEFREIFGTFGSVVRKITVAGVGLEIDSAAMQRIREFVGKTVDELMAKAKLEYDRMAEGFSVDERLSQIVRKALPRILTAHQLPEPENVRATVHVPDILFKDYLYQLVSYFPATAAGGPAGRRFSQRYGMIGRAWRMERSVGTGRAVRDPPQLIEFFGMNPNEAQTHPNPAVICVILRHEGVQVGVLFIDSPVENAFGRNGDAAGPPEATADQVAQALEAAPLTASLARAVAQVMEPMRLTTRIVDLSRNP